MTSRAAALRDAVASELTTELAGTATVSAFMVPRWSREELATGPRVGVRIGGRALTLGQGVDVTDVQIEIGVVAITASGVGATDYSAEELAQIDAADALLEQIIELWTKGGPLTNKGLAEHAPIAIEQAIQFDAEQLDSGVYLTMIRVTYRDSED